MTLIDTMAEGLAKRTSRRGFLGRVAMWGAAMVVAPSAFTLTPTSAYAAVCACRGQACDCNAKCCDGYTEFCCTITGQNACPPGGILGGWWKVDGSAFCGGAARYYMDCHLPCGDCACGDSGICSGSCNGTVCECGNKDCDNRKVGCSHFRYGNCNNDEACIGPILCRVVTCTAPWVVDDGCTTVQRTDNNTRYHDAPCLHDGANRPRGNLDFVGATTDTISLAGWAYDVDSFEPVSLHIYVDGRHVSTATADASRSDVQAAFGLRTDRVGFWHSFPAPGSGPKRVCVYAIDDAGIGNPLIGCSEVVVENGSPRGFIDSVELTSTGARIQGWAFDPDRDGPIDVHVYVDGKHEAIVTADQSRRDVQAAFGLAEPEHGFSAVVPVSSGTATVCAYAINEPAGDNPRLGCRSVSVAGRDPFGHLDAAVVSGNTLRVQGWAHDPDAVGFVEIHVYVDGLLVGAGTTGVSRSDVQASQGTGPVAGFDFGVPYPTGGRAVRVVAVNYGPGSNKTIGWAQL